MGNAPSSARNRRRNAPKQWQIPLNRGGIPVLKASAPRPAVRRKPMSTKTWNENNVNDAPVTWAELQRYLLHGPGK